MKDLAHINILDKARRHYRNERAKNSMLPSLVAGAGHVHANGVLKVELLCADGSRPTYVATPTMGWSFVSAPAVRKLHALSPQMEASLSDKARAALDLIVDFLARAEGHIDSGAAQVTRPDSFSAE